MLSAAATKTDPSGSDAGRSPPASRVGDVSAANPLHDGAGAANSSDSSRVEISRASGGSPSVNAPQNNSTYVDRRITTGNLSVRPSCGLLA